MLYICLQAEYSQHTAPGQALQNETHVEVRAAHGATKACAELHAARATMAPVNFIMQEETSKLLIREGLGVTNRPNAH
eukprot:18891-Heterococcus_DN1.PRE.3